MRTASHTSPVQRHAHTHHQPRPVACDGSPSASGARTRSCSADGGKRAHVDGRLDCRGASAHTGDRFPSNDAWEAALGKGQEIVASEALEDLRLRHPDRARTIERKPSLETRGRTAPRLGGGGAFSAPAEGPPLAGGLPIPIRPASAFHAAAGFDFWMLSLGISELVVEAGSHGVDREVMGVEVFEPDGWIRN